MAKFAILDDNDKVVNFIVAESLALANELLGAKCVDVTDKKEIIIGSVYNESNETFLKIPNKPFASWIWNESTKSWEAPLQYPSDGKQYFWNEEEQSWTMLPPGEGFIFDKTLNEWVPEVLPPGGLINNRPPEGYIYLAETKEWVSLQEHNDALKAANLQEINLPINN